MKNNYFLLKKEQQRTVLEQAAIRKILPKQAVEKDLWVTAILQIVFALPCSGSLVFKGGTSLSKGWGLISRFSEDIDLAIDRALFGMDGDLTKKQVKRLRKASSVYVREDLCTQLIDAVNQTPLKELCRIESQTDGEGDDTYPEPRSIFVRYQSVFEDKLKYIDPIVKIEVGSRSLIEPYANLQIQSMVEEVLPTLETAVKNTNVRTVLAGKTFLEKAFLLHELFSVHPFVEARRRSRHMYDLYMMEQKGIAERSILDDELWGTIHHLRSTLTSVRDVDYTPDIRDRICLVPPAESIDNWSKDYEEMKSAMIYGESPTFSELIQSMQALENKFRNRNTLSVVSVRSVRP